MDSSSSEQLEQEIAETKASVALRKLNLLKENVDSETSAVLEEIIKLIIDNEKDIHDEIEFICEAIRSEYEDV